MIVSHHRRLTYLSRHHDENLATITPLVSHPYKCPLPQPLSFDILTNARGVGGSALALLNSFVALCIKTAPQLFSNQSVPHSFSKMPGCHPTFPNSETSSQLPVNGRSIAMHTEGKSLLLFGMWAGGRPAGEDGDGVEQGECGCQISSRKSLGERFSGSKAKRARSMVARAPRLCMARPSK